MDHRLLDILVCPICKGFSNTGRRPGAGVQGRCACLSDSRWHPGDARVRRAQSRARRTRPLGPSGICCHRAGAAGVDAAAEQAAGRSRWRADGGSSGAQREKKRSARVIVAADDDEIVAACSAHGVDAMLTSKAHQSGTDRLAEAARSAGARSTHDRRQCAGRRAAIAARGRARRRAIAAFAGGLRDRDCSAFDRRRGRVLQSRRRQGRRRRRRRAR